MRKLLCIALCLLVVMLPALAEEGDFPSSYVGEWVCVLEANFDSGYLRTYPLGDDVDCIIAADGTLTLPGDEARHILQPAEKGYTLTLDGMEYTCGVMYCGLCISNADELVCFVRRDAQPIAEERALGTAAPAVSWDGDWMARQLFVWSSADCSGFSTQFPMNRLCEEAITLTLPLQQDPETLRQAWTAALARQGENSPTQGLGEITGYELRTPNTLLLHTRHGLVELIRTDDTRGCYYNRVSPRAGYWRADALIAGGVSMPVDAFSLPSRLTIDARDCARLDNELFRLQTVDNELCLGTYPIDVHLNSSGSPDALCLTLAEDVQLRFITEADWYQKQLTGTWQLSGVSIPALSIGANAAETAMSAQLIIGQDGMVTLLSGDDEQLFTLRATTVVTHFELVGWDSDVRCLDILSPDALTLSNEASTYTYHFTRAE